MVHIFWHSSNKSESMDIYLVPIWNNNIQIAIEQASIQDVHLFPFSVKVP
jgi:hypothetical protein